MAQYTSDYANLLHDCVTAAKTYADIVESTKAMPPCIRKDARQLKRALDRAIMKASTLAASIEQFYELRHRKKFGF